MMSKILKIKLSLVGMSLFIIPYVLGGCSADEELVFLSAETVQQENGEAPADLEDTESDLEDADSDTEDSDTLDTEIMVYLCGAVQSSGVVVLPEGSRINDAVQAAGGFTEDAAANTINLAAKLTDEEMIYVPTIEEVENGENDVSEAFQTASKSGLININIADVYTLCSLPGIGESKARDIVTYREKNGAFQQKEDIMQVAGIKEKLYSEICDLISVK